MRCAASCWRPAGAPARPSVRIAATDARRARGRRAVVRHADGVVGVPGGGAVPAAERSRELNHPGLRWQQELNAWTTHGGTDEHWQQDLDWQLLPML